MINANFNFQIEECVVCSDKRASILFKPCGHMCACDGELWRHDQVMVEDGLICIYLQVYTYIHLLSHLVYKSIYNQRLCGFILLFS